ncbi:MAG: ABC-type transport auxiliary lipoprotein family protein [Sulfuritalea sp.]|nr:ABC-type transport auxiliary lipoprotein family protein [Sulfuritalea sp.]
MMKRGAMVLAGLLLAACGGNVRTVEAVQYDLGSLGGHWAGSRIPIAAVEVQASSWLSGPAMHFRLAYAEPLRRQSYAESRWAAPPAELLERFLKRRIVFGQPDFSGTGCRLQLVLDELEQRFDGPQSSQQVLEVRALLTGSRGGETVSRRAFLIQKPTLTATAGGGVAATRDAVQALADDLGAWLDEAGREKPAIVERCRI